MKIFATIVAFILILGCGFLIVFWSIDIVKKLVARAKSKKEAKSKELGEKGKND